MRRATALLATGIALAACGGGGGSSPAAPSTPPPTPAPTPPPAISFVDGVTDEPVTPGSVTPANPALRDNVTVALEGYLTREQKWTGLPIALWPAPSEPQRARAYQDLIYGGENPRPLLKWGGMRYTAVLGPLAAEWASREPEIRDHLNGVFADIAAASGPAFSWAEGGLSYGGLTVVIDPAHECLQDGYLACTQTWWDGSNITRAELSFKGPDFAVNDRLAMHMMGYAIGLSDWSQRNSVMTPAWSDRVPTFHELERNAIHMMYQHRNAGNEPPDRDPGFAASARGRAVELHRERAQRW